MNWYFPQKEPPFKARAKAGLLSCRLRMSCLGLWTVRDQWEVLTHPKIQLISLTQTKEKTKCVSGVKEGLNREMRNSWAFREGVPNCGVAELQQEQSKNSGPLWLLLLCGDICLDKILDRAKLRRSNKLRHILRQVNPLPALLCGLPGQDAPWLLALGQGKSCRNNPRIWHKTWQGISEDLPRSCGANIPGSGKCQHISSQSSGFVARLQLRCPGGMLGLAEQPGTSSSLCQDKRTHVVGWKARPVSQVQELHEDPRRRAVVLMSLKL